MDLKGNTSYKRDFSPFINAAAGMVRNIQQKATAKPRINVQQYSNLRGAVNKRQPQGKTNLGIVTTPYGGSTRYEGKHPGIDIANKMGTNIPSFSSGNVIDMKSGYKQGDKGYGNYVIVQDPQGNKHRYSHLDKSYVQIGQPVTKGMAIGQMGNTGQTYSQSGGDASHLDYRIVDIYGKYINPSRFL